MLQSKVESKVTASEQKKMDMGVISYTLEFWVVGSIISPTHTASSRGPTKALA